MNKYQQWKLVDESDLPANFQSGMMWQGKSVELLAQTQDECVWGYRVNRNGDVTENPKSGRELPNEYVPSTLYYI